MPGLSDDNPEVEAVTEYITMLMDRGFIGAAHALSMHYWGYGLEDTDDEYLRKAMEDDEFRARSVVFASPAAVAQRAAERVQIMHEREAAFNRAYPEGVRNIRLDGSLM